MAVTAPGDVTRLLRELASGKEAPAAQLFPLVYAELRRLAASALRRERHNHTLQPTALVHEAFLRLVREERVQLESRAHFLAVAAQAMRRILVDHARRRLAARRGKAPTPVPLDEIDASVSADPSDVLSLDRALASLAIKDERLARIVELRYFAGLTVEETAEVLTISPRTVKRDWHIARAWLRRAIEGHDQS